MKRLALLTSGGDAPGMNAAIRAIVRVEACGVCRSDWHAWTGADSDVTPPHVPGHELAGIVEEVGRDCRRLKRGDRVTAPFVLACGQCPDCLGGDATICSNQHVVGFSSWGAFAERIAVLDKVVV